MTDIDDKLKRIRDKVDDGNFGKLYGAKETADDRLKLEYARLFCVAHGDTVPAKDAWVRVHPDYKRAIEDKQNAYADWKTAETYMKLVFLEADVWRTQQATERTIDRAHR